MYQLIRFVIVNQPILILQKTIIIDPNLGQKLMIITRQKQPKRRQLFNHADKQNRKPFISKQVQTELSMDWMYLDNGKYVRDKWSNIFPKLKKSSAKRLILQKNYHPTLIKEISQVNFNLLNVLNLKNNHITNIQALQLINFPNIQWLFLGKFLLKEKVKIHHQFLQDNNDITSLKPLAKIHTPNLKKIHFNKNHIKQIPLSKSRFNRNFISFDSEISCFNEPSQQDLSFLFKSNCQSIRSITFSSKRRIKQSKLWQKIQDRFSYINFYDAEQDILYNRVIFF